MNRHIRTILFLALIAVALGILGAQPALATATAVADEDERVRGLGGLGCLGRCAVLGGLRGEEDAGDGAAVEVEGEAAVDDASEDQGDDA